jgi:hypothetical protein
MSRRTNSREAMLARLVGVRHRGVDGAGRSKHRGPAQLGGDSVQGKHTTARATQRLEPLQMAFRMNQEQILARAGGRLTDFRAGVRLHPREYRQETVGGLRVPETWIVAHAIEMGEH